MNKLLLACLGTLFISSCAVIKAPEYYKTATSVDYSEYADNGFFVTESNSVSFNYTPVASIVATVRSGKDNSYTPSADGETKKSKDSVYGNRTSTASEWSNIRTALPEEALDELYKKARELGANGIINLKIESDVVTNFNNTQTVTTLNGYTATGMAILR